jgi:hypothetical protein
LPGVADNSGFGNIVHLKDINPKTTRTLMISEQLFDRLVLFSRKHFDVESYEYILNSLIDDYEKNNPDHYYWHNNNTDK